MFRYSLSTHYVQFTYGNGHLHTIYFNENSGKLYYRWKIDTISGVRHYGIFLGVDEYGVGYFMHNHFLTGKPSIVTEQDFCNGKNLYPGDRCVNQPLVTIQRALRQIQIGEPYKLLLHNCQTYTNQACNNIRRSEDVEKWVGRVLVGVALVGLISALTKA